MSVERGAMVGRYVVLATAGSGAMGVVLAAYDPELDRKVALKLLKLRGGDQDAARIRLQREAQALAKLDHRNVVSVHDVGMHEGQLFVAMEFVEGETLRSWMTQAGRPRQWPEVLRVMNEAGRGLAAAHAVGLIHRDFKPDNVMIGTDGRVRVMDFGLARATENEREATAPDLSLTNKSALSGTLTATGALLGTPAYMSSEQFGEGQVDARSDQFGFCVVVYEALYGERPFATGTLAQLVDAVSQGRIREPPRGVDVPAWLRKVVLQGLSPKPSERWPSMQALLDALADDPRVRRRRRAAGLGLLALIGGGAWGVFAAVQADARTCEGFEERLVGVWDDDRRAQVEAAIEATQSSYAADTWARVEQQLDAYTEAWLLARREACEATHRGEQSGELLDLRMACLDERLQHVHATVDVLATADTEVLHRAVEAVAGLPGLERCADADALMAEIPPPDDPAVAERVAELETQLIEIEALGNAGKYAQGLALVQPLVAEATQLGYEPLQARAWLSEGALLKDSGEYARAEATLKRAYESAVGQRMAVESAKASTTLVFLVGHDLARHEDGRRWAMHAKPLVRAAGGDDLLARYLSNLGSVAQSEGKFAEAREHFEQALAIEEKTMGPEHPSVATALDNLGFTATSEGKYEEARGYHERALSIHERALGAEHPNVGRSLTHLANVAAMQGKNDESRGYDERALAIYEQALGPDHPKVASTLNNLAYTATLEGKYDQARAYSERALAITEKALGPDHPQVATILVVLGTLAHMTGNQVEARARFERALAIWEALDPEHPDVAYALINLGSVGLAEGKYEDARARLERALAIREKALGPEHPEVAYAAVGIGQALLFEGKPAEALPYLERALALRTANPGDPLELAANRYFVARALLGTGRDRPRARALAELAGATYTEVGELRAKELRDVEALLAELGE